MLPITKLYIVTAPLVAEIDDAIESLLASASAREKTSAAECNSRFACSVATGNALLNSTTVHGVYQQPA